MITSGAAMACPIPLPALEAAAKPAGHKSKLSGETNDVCHKVRDGFSFPAPPPSKSVDVVVVGAGPAGVAAADALQGSDFLVLEKEPRVGGNAYAEKWNGLRYCTGSAWMSFFEPRVEALFKKWKIRDQARLIEGYDSGYFDGTWVLDFWDSKADSPRIDKLPYSADVKKGFRDFLRDLEKIDFVKDKDKLDATVFADLFKGRPEPLRGYWDQFGLSNWGGDTANSSAYAGATAARDWVRDSRYTFEGGLGVVPQKVFDQFPADVKKRFILSAGVYEVKPEGKSVLVRFFKDGKAECVSAKSVVFCAPKIIAARVVAGLPEDQRAAMAAMRYAPFPVYNMCFTRRVADLGYDSYVVGAKNMTDIIQADWVTRGRKAKPDEPQVLTIYAPMREPERADLLDDEETLARAERAAGEVLEAIGKKAEQHLAEVRVFRRGHPMPLAAPGWHTKLQPLARRDLPPVYFAHSDSTGEIADLSYAMSASLDAVAKAVKHVR